jgi:hypothetical protein
MIYFKWNDAEVITTTVWNTSITLRMEVHVQSLKERLKSPIGGKRDIDQLVDIGKGIAAIMDYIESREPK